MTSFLLLLAFAYYLPVILIWTGAIPFAYRFDMLVFVAALVAVHEIIRGRSLRMLGFRSDNLWSSLAANGALTAAIATLLLLAYAGGAIREPTVPSWRWFYVFYILVSSPCQEFLYRSALFAEMSAAGISRPAWQVACSATTYCFLHVIYHDALTLFVTAVIGVLWALIYRRHPNFWGVSLSHAVLGALSVSIGLV